MVGGDDFATKKIE